MIEDRAVLLEASAGGHAPDPVEKGPAEDPARPSAAPLAPLMALHMASDPGSALEVAECVDARHPTLRGRVLARRLNDPDAPTRWIPTLYRLPVREGDRLLVARTENWHEPIVIGVIDGFAKRPVPRDQTRAAIELKSDECLRVRSEEGAELVELGQSEDGPVVRLLSGDVDVELSGSFNLRAESIRFQSREGPVELDASHDVVVRGEVIRLN